MRWHLVLLVSCLVLGTSCLAAAPAKPCNMLCVNTVDWVCGVNGQSYENSCKAKCANVQVKHKGKCAVDKCANVRCNASEWLPVCGVNGITYQNQCVGECAAGVHIKHMGRCNNDRAPCVCAGRPQPVCASDGRIYSNECQARCNFLELNPKGCQVRSCENGCHKRVAPVCAGGKTYGNACLARCAGVRVFKRGSCKTTPKPNLPALFPLDPSTSNCGCSNIMNPVCTTEGKTYRNNCYANCFGEGILHLGWCPAPTVGQSDPALTTYHPDVDVHVLKDNGRACECSMKRRIVCGDDGRSYRNACHAHCSGAEVVRFGKCARRRALAPATPLDVMEDTADKVLDIQAKRQEHDLHVNRLRRLKLYKKLRKLRKHRKFRKFRKLRRSRKLRRFRKSRKLRRYRKSRKLRRYRKSRKLRRYRKSRKLRGNRKLKQKRFVSHRHHRTRPTQHHSTHKPGAVHHSTHKPGAMHHSKH